MSIKKLAAGSGYDYLTKQVAAQDATVPAGGLTSYYSERGEAPGSWFGSGLASLGLAPGDPVTAEQMELLFGAGEHPLAGQLRAEAAAAGLPPVEIEKAGRIGRPFHVRDTTPNVFLDEVAARCRAWNVAAGLPLRAKVPDDVKAQLRTEVGRDLFGRTYGRDPATVSELQGEIARWSKRAPVAVAGFDESFSPPKSVSVLWALADPQVSALVERCHLAAVRDTLAYQEKEALFTREGTDGVRQVDARGLVAVSFTHRDSRAGDPDLHTHVAIANKAQTLDGRWHTADSRRIFKSHVSASETYDTFLRAHLTATLGVDWVPRPSRKGNRPVWEIGGIDPALCRAWSSRRIDIEQKSTELATKFRADHGRPPTGVEMIHLAQQANLATRQAKHDPRTLAEQLTTWRQQADDLLGPDGVEHILQAALSHDPQRPPDLTARWFSQTAVRVVSELEASRATWESWHVRTEALRQLAGVPIPPEQLNPVIDRLISTVLDKHSWRLDPVGNGIDEPDALRRRDGHSVYEVAGSAMYSSSRILAAEGRLLATAAHTDGRRIDPAMVDLAMLESVANGVTLNPGQAALVRDLATSGRRLQLAIAPAGTGKTTALAVLANAWTSSAGLVIGLAPSAAAADVLSEHLTGPCDTLAKLAHAIEHPDTAPDWAQRIGPGTLVIIDEAGMADTPTLDKITTHVTSHGGSVRLVGDSHQLSAIAAGGILTDLAAAHGAIRLEEVLRFTDPAEAAASLSLRDGDPAAIAFYADTNRLHPSDATTIAGQVLAGWAADKQRGLDAIMLAPTRDLVAQLNHHARTLRLQGATPSTEVRLADGNCASIGDLVITRLNNRTLRSRGGGDWVKNGDRWHVTGVHHDGSLTATHVRTQRVIRLPANYVEAWTELGYATTIHTAQGVTADTCHGLLTGRETRQQLYTMATRGRDANHLHIQVTGDGLPHPLDHDSLTDHSAIDILERVLAHDDQAISATTHARQATDPVTLLAPSVAKYSDALGLAAEHHLGSDAVRRLEDKADQLVLFLTSEPAWATLKGHLVQLAANGLDPIDTLRDAINQGSIDDAHDVAALLDWRIDPTVHLPRGPLPWLPGVPKSLADEPTWGAYLTARANLVTHLADQVRNTTPAPSAARMSTTQHHLPEGLASDLRVWRASQNVPDHDARPTGPPANSAAATRWQQKLQRQLAETGMPDITPWWPQLKQLAPHLANDPQLPTLARVLEVYAGMGSDANHMLDRALHDGPLPAQGLAAALAWRLARHEQHPSSWPPVSTNHTIPRQPPEEAHSKRPRRDRGISI